MKAIFLICGVISVAFVLFISVYLVISGIPAIRQIGLKAFLLGKTWALDGVGGVLRHFAVYPHFGLRARRGRSCWGCPSAF